MKTPKEIYQKHLEESFKFSKDETIPWWEIAMKEYAKEVVKYTVQSAKSEIEFYNDILIRDSLIIAIEEQIIEELKL